MAAPLTFARLTWQPEAACAEVWPDACMTAVQIIEILNNHHIVEAEEVLQPDSDLFALGLDSLALMQLLLQIERSLSLSVPVAEIRREHFQTPASIAAWLGKLGEPKAVMGINS
jgi:acyl carrier protein